MQDTAIFDLVFTTLAKCANNNKTIYHFIHYIKQPSVNE